MGDDFDKAMWTYRGVAKLDSAGPKYIRATITMNSRSKLLYGVIGKNDYAAGRQIQIDMIDQDGNVTNSVFDKTGIDNQVFPFPWTDHSTVAGEDGNEWERQILFGRNDQLRLQALAMAEDELLTFTLRMLIDGEKPTVVYSSDGTIASTVDYDTVS